MNWGRLGRLDDLQMSAYAQHIPPKKKDHRNTTKQKIIVFDVFAENYGNIPAWANDSSGEESKRTWHHGNMDGWQAQ